MSTTESNGLSPEINPSQPTPVLTNSPSNPAFNSARTRPLLRATSPKPYQDLRFILSGSISDEVGLSHGDKLILVYEPATPCCVGLSGNPNLTSNRRTPRYRRKTARTNGYWTARLYPDQVQAFFSEELDGNNGTDHCFRPFHDQEITVDLAGQTIWFPLPYGRSIHLLSRYIDSFEGLDDFTSKWLNSTYPDSSRRMGTPNGPYWLPSGDPTRSDHEVHVSIPDHLLQDPIRNGSSDKCHGFNPWDPVQHQQILDYLETEVRAQIEGV